MSSPLIKLRGGTDRTPVIFITLVINHNNSDIDKGGGAGGGYR